MLVNLIPEFLSTLSAADRSAAYHEYLDRHRPVLGAYWQNYVLDPESPHAEPIIENALRADRSDLKRVLEDVDVWRSPRMRSAVRQRSWKRTVPSTSI